MVEGDAWCLRGFDGRRGIEGDKIDEEDDTKPSLSPSPSSSSSPFRRFFPGLFATSTFFEHVVELTSSPLRLFLREEQGEGGRGSGGGERVGEDEGEVFIIVPTKKEVFLSRLSFKIQPEGESQRDRRRRVDLGSSQKAGEGEKGADVIRRIDRRKTRKGRKKKKNKRKLEEEKKQRRKEEEEEKD